MSKVGRIKMKKLVAKIDHSGKLHVNIPAGMASSAPPLGSKLGQIRIANTAVLYLISPPKFSSSNFIPRNINIENFCKDFNKRTADIKEGIPLPCRVKVNSDRTYNLMIHKPPTTYYLKQAAGIQTARMKTGEVAGKITLKHLYEIAKIKMEDPPNALLDLQQMCKMLVGIARTCGIEIVHKIDPEVYEQFLKDRRVTIEEFREQLRIAKEGKVLREQTNL